MNFELKSTDRHRSVARCGIGPGVIGSEKIRTRGTADTVFVDLYLWVDSRTPLGEAHALSHVVKDRLMQQFPEVVDVVIHIEPPH